MLNRRTTLIAAVFCAIGIPMVGLAQDFPSKPVKVIVPHGAGGSTDITTRLVAEPFAENLGGQVAVVNVPGGGTAIGAQEAANAAPDGYTVAATHIALLTSSAMGANQMGPESLRPVAQLGSETQLVAVPADSDMQTLQDFYDSAAAGGEKPKLGISAGAANHFAFLRILGPVENPEVTFVPTGGGGPSLKALLGGSIDVGTFVVSEVIDQIDAGNLRPLAVFAEERHPDLPDTPTAAESGYPINIGIDYVWYVPAETPDEPVKVLADALEATIEDPALQETMLKRSIDPNFLRGEELEKVLEERWQTIQEIAQKIKD